jgi:protein-L-isoaspartate O-methyltransferase
MMTATYSPEDNKLRLYASTRLGQATYERVKAAGFHWAPKQDLFVAPMWTPQREDLLIELCGEVGDEDTSLVERAEQRAERFEEYHEARTEDAERAQKEVHRICDGIPLGQPILIGHHSEKRARKDAERIENGMRKAVKMWDTAQYWQSRAAGALRAAKYKELPGVRARRIKGLQADLRKQERAKEHQAERIARWSVPMTDEQARTLAGHSNTTTYETYFALDKGEITAQQAAATVIEQATKYAAWCERWIAHYTNRIAYETAMLAESGGTAADRTKPEVGGGCRCWVARGGWAYIRKVNKVSVTVEDNWGNGGRNFTRTVPFDELRGVMSKADVDAARAAGRLADNSTGTGFVILEPPQPQPESGGEPPQAETKTDGAAFDAMRDSLRAGVQVVSANQLFPTPPDLAARMVELADIAPGARVLEPSAGTGNILREIGTAPAEIMAVEINATLAQKLLDLRLSGVLPNLRICRADFLTSNGDLGGPFDRVVMNPPFERGDDIKHIRHALTMLKPGGRLVAICANGPRQQEQLKPLASTWEELPEGTFAGTGVHAALLVIER